MKDELLIIFYRNPILGKVKTRLAATLGDEKALAIYLHMAAYTRTITENLHLDKAVFYSEHVDTEDNWSNTSFKKQLQHGEDLGERMKHAFTWAFDSGYKSVCIIATDCLELTSETILDAFDCLEIGDIVIGPARDGGYYLLGMTQLQEPFFKNKQWGMHTVFSDTLEDINEAKLTYELLPILHDVDEEGDLPKRFRL